MKRRKFLTQFKRWFLLAGLLGTGGLLIYRRPKGYPDSCSASPLCKGCNKFNSCDRIASSKPLQNESKG